MLSLSFSSLPNALQPSSFLHLPFAEQLERLKEALSSQDPKILLQLCACSRDHEPLIFALGSLFSSGWPQSPREQSWLAEFLLQQPDSAILQVSLLIESLLTEASPPSSTLLQASLVSVLIHFVQSAPLSRIQGYCLLDRQLLKHFPTEHKEVLDQLQTTCQTHLEQGTLDTLAPITLLKLPAARLSSLRPQTHQQEAFRQFLERAAHDAIEVLASVPKPISQARAEELLSKRVYDDPGHFLFELLQNAEDQQARRWSLHFSATQIFIWHDGLPFDVRDLVGVTSIGQSNKKRHQIGFFGVGFKSVYEVTRRPQIYSEAYQFEIADVSMPRMLQERPSRVPQTIPSTGTLLVLPLREQTQEARHPAQLYKRTHDLDPVILLTLRSLEQIDVTLDPDLYEHLPPSLQAQQQLRLQGDRLQAHVKVHLTDPAETRHYLLANAQIDVAPGLRSAEKTSQTRLLIGMLCDEQGIPQPLPPKSPRLYSFLPTAEDPGLHFFVQAHFDVPVDRERISRESRWNQYLLQQIPQLLARMAQDLFQAYNQAQDPAPLRGFLRLLPHPQKLNDPLFRKMAQTLPAVLASAPIFPDASGEIRSPQQLYLASPSLSQLLEDLPLPQQLFQEQTSHLNALSTNPSRWSAAKDLDKEEEQQLQHLGVPTFTAPMLLDLLTLWLKDHPDHAPPPQEIASLFASHRIHRLYQQLDLLLRAQQSEGTSLYANSLQRLCRLPLLLDEQGLLFRGESGLLALASPALRDAWGTQRRFVPLSLEQKMRDILVQMGARQLTYQDLFDDLSLSIGQSTLSQEDYNTRWPIPREKLYESLAFATDKERQHFARLPLFLAHDHLLHPLAQKISDEGAFAIPEDATYPSLFALLSPTFPILTSKTKPPSNFVPLRLTPAHVVALVSHSPDRFQDRLLQVHETLGLMAQDLSHVQLQMLCDAPLWQSLQGKISSLTSPDAPYLTVDPALPLFFPQDDFVQPAIASQPHVLKLSLPKRDAIDLFHALSQRAHPIEEANTHLQEAASLSALPQPLEVLQDYLLQHAALLRSLPLEKRAHTPLFLDQRGLFLSASQLSRSPHPTWLPLLQHLEERHYLATEPPSQEKLLQALDLDAAMQKVDPPEILRACLAKAHLFSKEEKHQLLALIAKQAEDLPHSILESTRKSALFLDTEGKEAPLGDWNKTPWREGIPHSVIFRCEDPALRSLLEQAGFRLLLPTLQETLSPLFQPLSLRDALLNDLFDILQSPSLRASFFQAAHLSQLRDYLLQNKETLQALYPPQTREDRPPGHPFLEELPLFYNQLEQPTPIAHMTTSTLLDALWMASNDPSPLAKRRLHPNEASALSAFEGLVAPAPPLACFREAIEEIAQPLKPLVEQAYPLHTLQTLQELQHALSTDCSIKERLAWPIWADRKQRLRKAPLYRQNQLDITWFEGLSLAHALLHPQLENALSNEEKEHFPALTAYQVLEALSAITYSGQSLENHRHLGTLEHRIKLYDFLQEHWESLRKDPRSEKYLRTAALFATTQGQLRSLYELQWEPNSTEEHLYEPEESIPSSLCNRLERLALEQPLSIQDQARPRFERWLEAAEQHDLQAFERAFETLAHLWQHAPNAQQKQLLQAAPTKELSIPTSTGTWTRLSQALLPSALDLQDLEHLLESSARPTPPKHPASLDLLHALGAMAHPTAAQLEEAFTKPLSTAAYRSFASYLQRHPACLPPETLRRLPWVLDDASQPHLPSELFWFDERIQRLVPDAKGLFPASFYEECLPSHLQKPLRFRSIKDLRVEDVLPALPHETTLESELLNWLERGLKDKRFKAEAIQEACAYRHRLLCHDGSAHYPHQTLGIPPSPLFAEMRGFWPEGKHRYPHLCKALRIPTQLTPDVVRRFLESMGQDARKDHGQALLQSTPKLITALPLCYAYLHEQKASLQTNVPIYLAEAIEPIAPQTNKTNKKDKPLQSPRKYALLHNDTLGFFVCLRPTLLDPYRGLSFYTAVLGPDDIAQETAQFLLQQGIPAFEQATTVKISPKAGKDTTQRHDTEVEALRTLFRALRAVLPRVQAQRGGPSKEWTFATQLEQLIKPSAIRIIQGLKVKATLKDVGKLDIPDLIAYDPQKHRLMLDETILRSLQQAVPLLASHLAPLIHRDPQRQALTDMLELLLRCQTLEAMQTYLDQRHFPRVALQDSKEKGKNKKPQESFQEALSFDAVPQQEDEEDVPKGFFKRLWSRFSSSPKSNPDQEKPPTSPSAPPSQEAPSPPRRREQDPATPPKQPALEKPRPTPKERPIQEQPSPKESPMPPKDPTGLSDFFNNLFSSPETSSSKGQTSPEDWNRPNDRIGPQLNFDPKRFSQHAPNPEDLGLFHQPTTLPLPYRYALQNFTGRFDTPSQQWHPAPLQKPLVSTTTTKVGSLILQGKLPPGPNKLPLPLHSALSGPPVITCDGEAAAFKTFEEPSGTYTLQIKAPHIVDIRYHVDLFAAPIILSNETATLPKDYTQTTMRRRDLPTSLQDFLADLERQKSTQQEKAQQIEQLVRKRYLYDMHHAQRPAFQEARDLLPSKPRDPQNHSIMLLHAGKHGSYWGAGVCHGLNILIAELLRQVDIPSAVATCWVLDEGYLSRPDHLIALALLPTTEGVTYLPLDGAVNAQGRVLHHASPPPPRHAPKLPKTPSPDTQRAALLAQIELYSHFLQQLQLPLEHIDASSLETSALQRHFQALRQQLLQALGSKALLYRLLSVVDAGEVQVEHLDGPLQTLLERGLLQVDQQTSWRIRPLKRS